ncbi:hypothetical protein H4J51_10560 [Colwellia sp. MB02u-18]|uniref:hypothetical protein n=1 Tax=unclassified Colwellia TaxID=196834 RepID=UPI0015F73CF8|nr:MULTISPECIES: hypothetical protein [unclassified Colwellia]MBA6225622.1 hypothetical protein [Colwellia sp. MB3u-45]MBA6266870.1 hypothetical protein [Colwellia sp. MB3u-43]MBA6321782.1 hypothetical protein [Colwellia sp. MB02u-19]MBA6325012.1 hypothetical protein [Colwellia sp. MB02u-18]MBA6331377.1 hypothetical protein [Colwellia sp. MB02u-12]
MTKKKLQSSGRRFRLSRLALSKTAIAQLQALALNTQLNTQVAMSAIIDILTNALAKKDQKE